MHEIAIERYTPGCREEWDSFVRQSRNGTFLFCRDYMDYHSDRFCDHSLMARHKGRLYAVLPANQEGSMLHSHQGLTYGGWVVGDRVGVEGMGTLFRLLTTYAHGQGLSAMPWRAARAVRGACSPARSFACGTEASRPRQRRSL